MNSDLKSLLPRPDADGSSFMPTKNGDEALRKGSQIFTASSAFGFFGVQAPSPSEIEALGKKNLLVWFGTFYKRLMEDPRMAVLFDTTSEEANVSVAEHGERLALALLSRWTGDQEYFTRVSGGRSMFARLHVAHDRAKDCPMRSSTLRTRGFTTGQRDSWLGHLWLAGASCDVPSALCDQVVNNLASIIGVYGPFVKDHDHLA